MTDHPGRLPVGALFDPASIAILGASERPGSIGAIVMQSLRRCGFAGDVWQINPRYGTLFGERCFPALDALPSAPDLVAICTSGASAGDHLAAMAAVGAKAAVIYDGGFAETGEEGRQRQAELAAFARENGIAVCGPNCMGALNAVTGATTYKLPLLDRERLCGNVGMISQSGSITIGMLGDTRRFGFSRVVSTGNEMVLSAADFLDDFVDDPDTRCIALFLESVRDPEAFQAALVRAAQAGKPVVVLKVGRSRRSVDAVASHTGGLAGEARTFSQMLARHAAIEVGDLDEMTEVLAALQVTRPLRGRRIGVVTGSGGQAELMLDIAEDHALALPPLDHPTRSAIEEVVGHLTGDGNPVDAWGNGDVNRNLPHVFSVLDRHPNFNCIVLCNENVDSAPIGRAEGVMRLFCQSAAQSDKPHFALNMRPGLMHADNVAMLAKVGAGMLGGARQGLLAIDRIARAQALRSQVRPPSPVGAAIALPGKPGRTINEHESKRILARHGVPIGEEYLAANLDEARAAAAKLGWPVVVKAISDDLPHKTELGAVRLNITNDDALAAAMADIDRRIAAAGRPIVLAGYLVQPMVREGVEVFAGLKRDPQWGTALLFGVGGVLIELIAESALRLLPASDEDIDAMLRETRAWALLNGLRGEPPADIAALRSCLRALADFGVAAGPALAELDLNPIKVLPEGRGVRILDALIVTR